MADADRKIDPVFRSGTLTGVGVITGFSLTFLCNWAANPLPWQVLDLIAVLPLSTGIILQVWSLARLLNPSALYWTRYNSIRIMFLIGLILVVVGVMASLVLDAIEVTELRR
jgi:hypothetical protein